MIEFLNLQKLNQPYFKEFEKKANSIIKSGWYILGNEVESFENEFANYVQAKFCVGVASGLDAIKLILKGLIKLNKLQKKDEVLLASNSYIATVLAVSECGLTPKFVEPDEFFNIDVSKVKDAITPKTKAILATSLYGQSANYDELKKFGLLVIDDASQAHGSTHHDRKNGSLADATAFSFYPTKNLGALGDGGAVTTDDEELSLMIKKLRNYGSLEKNLHDIKGVNSRLDELQAGFLRIKLRHLDSIIKKREELANFYLQNINHPEITLPKVESFNSPAWHLFVIRVKNQKELQKKLLKKGVQTAIHYPKTIFEQKAYSELDDNFVIAKTFAKEVLSLPLNETMSFDEATFVVQALKETL